ncbi:hypothetical protein QA601_16010 [Chitinispirillales bacterium ANBcel5]|uniref:carboxypeptidase-like regulatory domain-containing protein n=1 Tax=Cellulosispirillum alkaliphilum TaxID=3039283 RepID=UPI002A504407|nr:hypothetical protein [Chitinispirillales bacterium ANBcel5]
MNKLIVFLMYTFLIQFITVHVRCTSEIVGGGSTETIGKVSFSDGTPAADVEILFVPEDFEPQFDTPHPAIRSTVSDNKGRYDFGSLSDGRYNIFFEKKGLKAYRRAVEIVENKTQEDISDTLYKPGSVSGIVRLLDYHDHSDVFILVTGSNHYVTPKDSCGNFTIKDFAQGQYNLKIIAGYPNYDIIDTSVIITSGIKDTIADTIFLPYIGIPSPESLIAHYDSSMLELTLSWPRIDSPNLDGYAVLRKEYGSEENFSMVSSTIITDTFFVDMCDGINTVAGKTYSYRVTAVNNEGVSGKPGEAVEVTYHQSPPFADSLFIRPFGEDVITGISHSFDSALAVVFSDTSALFIINLSERRIASVSLPENALPFSVSVMEDSTFIVATNKGIYNIDRQGNRLYWYNIQTTTLFSRESRYIYYVSRNDFHTHFNTFGSLDTYTGIDEPIVSFKDSEIQAVTANNTTVSFAISRYNQLIFKASDFEASVTKNVFGPVKNVAKSTVTAADHDFFITYGKIICRLSGDNYQIIARKMAPDHIEAAGWQPDLRKLFILSKEGYLYSTEMKM